MDLDRYGEEDSGVIEEWIVDEAYCTPTSGADVPRLRPSTYRPGCGKMAKLRLLGLKHCTLTPAAGALQGPVTRSRMTDHGEKIPPSAQILGCTEWKVKRRARNIARHDNSMRHFLVGERSTHEK